MDFVQSQQCQLNAVIHQLITGKTEMPNRVLADIVERKTLESDLHEMTVAVSSKSRNGDEVELDKINLSNYKRNPVILYNHGSQWTLPIGRTEKIYREDGKIKVQFKFVKGDSFANRIKNLWNQKVLNAASISYNRFGEKKELLEWSIVTVGADPLAVRSLLNEFNLEIPEMDESEIKRLIEETIEKALSSNKDESKIDQSALAESISKSVNDLISKSETDAQTEREAREAKEKEIKEIKETAYRDATNRVNLLAKVKPLLEENEKVDDLTNRELLEKCLAKTIESRNLKMEDCTDDYLMATLDLISEERSLAKEKIDNSKITENPIDKNVNMGFANFTDAIHMRHNEILEEQSKMQINRSV